MFRDDQTVELIRAASEAREFERRQIEEAVRGRGGPSSLTITEAGDLLPTFKEGGVLDKHGVYRPCEDERHPEDRELRYLEGREF